MTTTEPTTPDAPIAEVPQQRVHFGEPEHFEIVEFLEDEAYLLDSGKLLEWVGLMTPDLRYRMPVRSTRDLVDGSEFSDGMFMFDETILTLGIKATRLAATMSAWAEKPPSRTRRHVTNIRVFRAGDDEYEVTSSLLLLRNRYQEHNFEIVSARRVDRIRRQDGVLKIAKRTIYSDQATLGTQNLAIFL
ncbi:MULTISPECIES: aromatic-ring-hydroxylating dioxygenase subunit beta [Mycolicibacter]|uniref:Aromatic-ring-hydroxylating dioxygenase subunit beta n=1 Tax=Mycolicibacter kumamotonensis TaxID=354243 RepID=A0A7K3L697_9MYCO|nr:MULTISPECIES: aromatic-ring-hydroxylating dioxygenase subunit beta [Mycolicibacter]NDJ87954.1 aromatic-ring-hydroxylating dioxygenase subunit beta [Mycolicibacter kumamotonensis]RAV03865.1 aromatic-ring-hydroxylating dioxygenase subunit beta [Mycolicibacter senuensis]